jgi:hypothetical protein
MPISTVSQKGLDAPLSLTTPNLGTPSALVLTNATGTPSAINLSNATSLPRTALPSGSVIQTVYVAYGSSVATSSTSPIALGPQISITTTVANSKILVSLSAPCQLNSGSAGQFNIAWRNSTDSYASSTAIYPAVIQDNWYELPSHFQTYSNPSQPAGTTITYKIYANRVSGSGSLYLVDGWSTGYSGMPIIAMEIAP